ncbi:MAG: hypothetical protein A3H98_11605 [Bacteroidetes bacterium RIFCSPLOWO2_02_FULL_36_8]|nr:MAG: hypothetical protein A3H98_11605 [Bacteroidetes bacterium RIFCSPLOWO2_02_FULL_36_8]OFY69616.1 MAG: hypothetical protein A3G23_13860 [Bacteroidetes bacterium RIFCSPLOWO2_12_FULL_37_12]
MDNQLSFKKIILIAINFVFLTSCYIQGPLIRSHYENVNKLIHGTQGIYTKPFLKAHLKNGQICIFDSTWSVDKDRNNILGVAVRYDLRRKKMTTSAIVLPVDSVAIFETNQLEENPEYQRMTTIGILTGVNIALGFYCLINPKACFGSCPTFYLNKDDNFHFADAEGFTDAIAPCLEYTDIDALNNKTVSKNFTLTVKNEAMETHCIRSLKLLAYPRIENERIYHTPNDEFFLCDKIIPLSGATSTEGDISVLLKSADRLERFSLADEKNLISKEEIFLEFNSATAIKNLGMILHFRQTLMSTYLLYSALGYMGDKVSDVFSKIELQPETRKNWDKIKNELGRIDVFLQNSVTGKWEFQEQIFESGPIAINRQMLPLKNSASGSVFRIKLVLNKGLWRIDYAGLTTIKEKVVPLEIMPLEVTTKGEKKEEALKSLLDKENFLINLPGAEYDVRFQFPDENQDYELFLQSTGYYLEWIRQEWLKNKDLGKLKMMVIRPKKFLKYTAKEYKHYEQTMEQEFWNSKVNAKTVLSE